MKNDYSGPFTDTPTEKLDYYPANMHHKVAF